MIFVSSVMRVVGYTFTGSMSVSSCRCVLTSGLYFVAILSVVFCVICILLRFVFHHIVEMYRVWVLL